MEDEETLHSDALISQLAGVGWQRSTMSLLNHVVVSAVVVGCVLLPRQELFWVEQLVMNMYRQTYIHTGRSNPNTGITLFGSSEHAPQSKQESTWGQSGLVLIERWLIYRGRQQC